MEILAIVSDDRIAELQRQGSWLYEQYLSSIKAITLTTLKILNDRVFPQNAHTYQDWNVPPEPVSIFYIHIYHISVILIILLMLLFVGPINILFYAYTVGIR